MHLFIEQSGWLLEDLPMLEYWAGETHVTIQVLTEATLPTENEVFKTLSSLPIGQMNTP